MTKPLALLLLLLLASLPANAGNRVGNGGDIVTCEKPTRSTILDFYEVWRFADPMKGEKGSPEEILSKVLHNLAKVAPELATQYQKRSKTIVSEIDFNEEVKPAEIKDSVHAFEPDDENCKILQLALRIAEPPAGAKKFLIHKKRYTSLSPSAQAGILLHEIVYEHLGRLGESDSRRVRKLVAHLFAPEFKSETKGKFWLFIKELKVPIYP